MPAAERDDCEVSAPGSRVPVLDEPVVVLTCARSGSTLLRMILDAHPELACPPETNIAKLSLQLFDLWQLLQPGSGDSAASESARAQVRMTVDSLIGSYLTSQGKVRWCDKSLGTAPVAENFLAIYEKTKFICLYRHAMDVINSALEASPWGVYGYGFDAYTRSQLNSVSALASYWIDFTSQTLSFEEAHPDRCLRVYYEELVTDPERVAAEVFDFIGVAPVPGITRYALLDQERPDIFGYGDHKIRVSNQVTDASVGRGSRVPVSMMRPAQLTALNQVLDRLGYTEVNNAWQVSACPLPLLVRSGGPAVNGEPDVADGADAATPEDSQRLEEPDEHPLAARFEEFDEELTRRVNRALGSLPAALQIWNAVGIVVYSLTSPRIAQAWRIDCAGKVLDSDQEVEFEQLNVDWLLTGEIDVWLSVLRGAEDFSFAMRHGRIRCIGKETLITGIVDGDSAESNLRVRMGTHLLELGNSGLD